MVTAKFSFGLRPRGCSNSNFRKKRSGNKRGKDVSQVKNYLQLFFRENGESERILGRIGETSEMNGKKGKTQGQCSDLQFNLLRFGILKNINLTNKVNLKPQKKNLLNRTKIANNQQTFKRSICYHRTFFSKKRIKLFCKDFRTISV